MGKFLKDSNGNLVAIEGGLVLERILDRKPRDCESCGFSKWVKKDKVFIIQGGSGTNKSTSTTATTTTTANDNNNDTSNNNNTSMSSSSTNEVLGGYAGGGSMEWICPECALNRGLTIEFYHKNFHAPGNAEARHKKSQSQATAKKAKNNSGGNNNNNNSNNGSSSSSGLNKLLDMTSSLCRF